MDWSTPLVTGVLIALFTAIQAWINKGRFDYLKAETTAIRSELAAFRSDVSSDIATLRSDLLQVALAATGRRDTG